MPDLVTFEQRMAVIQRKLKTIPGLKLNPASVKTKGSLANIVAAIAIALAEDVEGRFFSKLNALTLDGAEGDELDALVTEETFGVVTRKGASAAVVPITFTRALADAGPSTSVDFAQAIDIGGVAFNFRDTAPSFGAGQVGPITVYATAASVGLSTNVAKTAAVTLVGATGNVAKIAGSLSVDAAGGNESETSPQLRDRARRFPSSVRRGTLGAIELGALSVPGIMQAVAEEPLDSNGEAIGRVLVYLADINGNCNNALLDLVRIELLDWGCAGVPRRLVGSVPSYQAIKLAILYSDGVVTEKVQALVRDAVVNAVNATEPGQDLLRSLIVSTIRGVPGAVVPNGAVVSPVGDIAGTPGTTYKTRADLVSFV